MRTILQSFVLLLVLMVPSAAPATCVQLADGVYQDGVTRDIITLDKHEAWVLSDHIVTITPSVSPLSAETDFTLLGDVNCDGYVDVGDVVALIDYVLECGSSSSIRPMLI